MPVTSDGLQAEVAQACPLTAFRATACLLGPSRPPTLAQPRRQHQASGLGFREEPSKFVELPDSKKAVFARRRRRPARTEHRNAPRAPRCSVAPACCTAQPGWPCAVGATRLGSASSHRHLTHGSGRARPRCSAVCSHRPAGMEGVVAVDLVTGSVQAAASTALLPGLSASSAVVASPATLAAMVDEELG